MSRPDSIHFRRSARSAAALLRSRAEAFAIVTARRNGVQIQIFEVSE